MIKKTKDKIIELNESRIKKAENNIRIKTEPRQQNKGALQMFMGIQIFEETNNTFKDNEPNYNNIQSIA